MEPISLIMAALAVGAAAGLTDTATSAVKDAYAGLRGLVQRLLVGRPAASTALAEHARDPQVWEARLAAELERAGAVDDQEILAAAQRVLAEADRAGAQAGKYRLDLRGAQVGQVGDHNTATVTFGSPPPRG